jgi:hypothetical protein
MSQRRGRGAWDQGAAVRAGPGQCLLIHQHVLQAAPENGRRALDAQVRLEPFVVGRQHRRHT